MLRNIWTGTKARFVGQFGVYADYNLTSNLKLGLELQANVLPDGYNSKKAGNADWYFNGLVGVKYAFGTTFTKQKRKKCCAATAEPKIIEKIVEVPVREDRSQGSNQGSARTSYPRRILQDFYHQDHQGRNV